MGILNGFTSPELPRVLNQGICLKSCRDSNHTLGTFLN